MTQIQTVLYDAKYTLENTKGPSIMDNPDEGKQIYTRPIKGILSCWKQYDRSVFFSGFLHQ